MRKTLLILLTIVLSSSLQAQQIEKLGLRLENYNYPYEVKFYAFNSQEQSLEMGYMDVKQCMSAKP